MPTVSRFYYAYADANRVILLLEIAGVPVSDTSLVFNNCDIWYRGAVASDLVPLRKRSECSGAGPRIEDAIGVGATVGTAASLITMLAVPGVGPVVGVGWLAAILGGMAAGGVTGGLLGALTNGNQRRRCTGSG